MLFDLPDGSSEESDEDAASNRGCCGEDVEDRDWI